MLESVYAGHVHLLIIVLVNDSLEHVATIPVLQESNVLTEAQVSIPTGSCELYILWLHVG